MENEDLSSLATLDQPTDEAVENDAPETSAGPEEAPEKSDSDAGDEEGKLSTPAQAGDADARAKEAARVLREMRQDPERQAVGKELGDAFYREREYRNLYGTVEEARNYRYAVEAAGGLDGLNEALEVAQGAREMDRMFDEGDPAVIEEFSRESPEGFKKLVPAALERYAAVDPNGYASIQRNAAGQFLQGSYIPAFMNEISDCLNQNDVAGACRAFNRVAEAMTRIMEPGAAGSANPAAGARETRTTQAADTEAFTRQVSGEISRHLEGEVTAACKALGADKLQPQALRRYRSLVIAEMDRMEDEPYRRTRDAIARRTDPERFTKFVNGHVSEIAGKAARTVWNDLYGQAGPRASAPARTAKATTRPAESATSERRLMKPPAISELDQSRPGALDDYFKGRGHLKNGQPVRWR